LKFDASAFGGSEPIAQAGADIGRGIEIDPLVNVFVINPAVN
jgi:hypothetical protein